MGTLNETRKWHGCWLREEGLGWGSRGRDCSTGIRHGNVERNQKWHGCWEGETELVSQLVF